MAIFSKSAALAVLAFMATVDAHMMMKTPVPYGKSTLNNSPLDGQGADFPCKQRAGVYDAEGASNVVAIGEPQTLSFIGGATHGGGSCQVSLTTDLQPTKDSKWMVIKSIIGGCPSNATGNLNGDPASTDASTFQFTVPQGIAPGDYTMAWTWFNHIGNREMYMNCAPMTVTGAKKKRYAPAPKVSKRQSSFPDMYVANIDGTVCQVPESVDIVFPNPGSDVQTAGSGPFVSASCDLGHGSVAAAQQPTGSPSAASGSSSVASSTPTPPVSGFAGGSGQYSQAAGSSSPSAALPQVIPVTTTAGQSFGPTPVSVSQTMTAPMYTNTSTAQIAPGNTAAPSGTAPAGIAPADPAAPASSGSAGQLSGPCANEGDWNCIDGSSFQRCASGAWSASIPLSGMKCTPGETSNFVMTPGKVKRFTTSIKN